MGQTLLSILQLLLVIFQNQCSTKTRSAAIFNSVFTAADDRTMCYPNQFTSGIENQPTGTFSLVFSRIKFKIKIKRYSISLHLRVSPYEFTER